MVLTRRRLYPLFRRRDSREGRMCRYNRARPPTHTCARLHMRPTTEQDRERERERQDGEHALGEDFSVPVGCFDSEKKERGSPREDGGIRSEIAFVDEISITFSFTSFSYYTFEIHNSDKKYSNTKNIMRSEFSGHLR